MPHASPSTRLQTFRRCWLTFLSGALLLTSAGLLRAQVLLINIADPGAVTFTGTGTFASASFNSGTSDAFPVRLAGFFTSDQSNFDSIATSTSLATTGADHTLGRAFLRVGAGGPRTLLLRKDGNSQEVFSTSAAAFTGTATYDLSLLTGALPTAGTSGNIYASNGTTVVGTYSVISSVPEPTTVALFAGMAGLVATIRIRRRRK